ncbi:MAG: hypothetical protein HQK73_11320 [Desulfamplus sp.]|nr:hypothetical protein [Desulfamplus sp.]MBF0412028.1 hypothetical protein [Desulfamplus sp.]
MIKFIFYFILSLSLIVIQTSVFPSLSFFSHSFDMLLIIILFLSLMFSSYALILAVFLIGWCMDSLSGAPLGLYTIAYIWIFIMVQVLKKFVHRGNIIFLPFISAFSVMMENGFLFFSFFIRYGREAFSFQELLVALEHSIWAFFLIPTCCVVLYGAHNICDRLDSKGVI